MRKNLADYGKIRNLYKGTDKERTKGCSIMAFTSRTNDKNNTKEMELREYQQQAMQTCAPSSDNLAYMLLNLQGEVGEFSSKVAKAIRKDELRIDDNDIVINMHTSRERANTFYEELRKEGGDMLWQLFGVFSALGWDAEVVAAQNLAKLRDRAERGKIIGDGDNR